MRRRRSSDDNFCSRCGTFLYRYRPGDDIDEMVIGSCGCQLCLPCVVKLGGYADEESIPEEVLEEDLLERCMCNLPPKPPPKLSKLCVVALADKLSFELETLPDGLGVKIAKRLAKKYESLED